MSDTLLNNTPLIDIKIGGIRATYHADGWTNNGRNLSDIMAVAEEAVEIRPPWEIWDTRPALMDMACELLGELFTAASERQTAEQAATALQAAAAEADIPAYVDELRMITGAGRAAHQHRSTALAYASLLWTSETAWSRDRATDGQTLAMAATLLEVYQWGDGGGWSCPGSGTQRGTDPDVLQELATLVCRLGVPMGGGFHRRYATGGDAWTAAAAAAQQRLGVKAVSWAYIKQLHTAENEHLIDLVAPRDARDTMRRAALRELYDSTIEIKGTT
jgi:hypothetical protein